MFCFCFGLFVCFCCFVDLFGVMLLCYVVVDFSSLATSFETTFLLFVKNIVDRRTFVTRVPGRNKSK